MRRLAMSLGMSRRRRVAVAVLVIVAVGTWGGAASGASELIVQNDSIAPPGNGTPLNTLVPGEIVAAWLTTPVAGDIVGVQVLWDSPLGTNFPSTEAFIRIYAAGTFPTPGAELAKITSPILNDTMINEFRFLDPPADTMALQVPVTAGQTFVVGLELFNQSSGNAIASGVEYDVDGCQASSNAVLAIPGGWTDACSAGVTGDFGIRAIVQSVPLPAAVWPAAAVLGGAVMASRRRGRRQV